MTEKKRNKVRTSITIDPHLLAEIKRDNGSVSAYLEDAARYYRSQGSPKLEE
jgi:hypothetical protein